MLCCTPTYAIRLGEARQAEGIETAIRLIIVAGEPGGSVPTRPPPDRRATDPRSTTTG
ncbi:MAG: hypothetical protein R3F11_30265 [Verrucomicrobiales bacterium]